MYITITPQKLGSNYAESASGFVSYLEKENGGRAMEEKEHFFNQYGEEISGAEVIQGIDGNTAKLKKTEPKFYSITVNPSKRELQQLQNHGKDLKDYTRELMKDYAKAFNREIDGRKVTVDDIKYYAKVEYQRTFKGNDIEIKENQPYATKILELKKEIWAIQEGRVMGNVKNLEREITRLEKEAPHQQNGKRIVRGMPKEGAQAHVHIIVSRKDVSNQFSLSPGSKYKASEVVMNGKKVKRGFNRDKFFKNSERTFDTMFHYKRNYVETYAARKAYMKHPEKYFANIMGLPTNEKAVAFKLLGKSGVNTAIFSIPTNKVQMTLKAIKKIKRGMDRAIQSGSIGI